MAAWQPATVIFLAVCGCLGGFVDSVIGGGGVVTLPALLVAGVPPALALGTNKLAGTCASATATAVFAGARRVDRGLMLRAGPPVVLAAMTGALLSTRLNAAALRILVIVAVLGAAVYALVRGEASAARQPSPLARRAGLVAATGVGLYDGVLGPGAGLFYFAALVGLRGLAFVDAAGTGRALNLASNVGALAVFVALGRVSPAFALPVAAGVVLGARVGSRLTLRRGPAFVRPMLAGVTVLLVLRLALQAAGH